VYGVAAICLVALMWLTGLSPYGYPATAYGWMILLALVPQLVGHSSFNWALKYLPASLVSGTLLGERIGSTLLAFLFLKETPSVVELMGGVLILFGIYLASRTSGN
jgi:drug/metabolite transporter (DMT)-like permease